MRAYSLTAEAAWMTLKEGSLAQVSEWRSVAAPNANVPDVGRYRPRRLLGLPRSRSDQDMPSSHRRGLKEALIATIRER